MADPVASDEAPEMEMADEHTDVDFGEPAEASAADRVVEVMANRIWPDDYGHPPKVRGRRIVECGRRLRYG